MLRLFRLWVSKCEKGFVHISWYAGVQRPVFVVPLETYSNILFAFPIHSDIVPSLQCSFEMVGMLVALELYPKVIYHSSEGDWAPHVLPQAWSKLSKMVSFFPHAFDKKFIGNFARLQKDIHTLFNFAIDISIVHYFG